jgi:hypothetical protein
MKKLLITLGIFLVLSFCVVAVFNLFIQNKDGGFVKGEIIVVFKPEITEDDARATIEKYNLKVPESFYKYDYVSFYSNDNNLNSYAEQLEKLPLVKEANVVIGANSSKSWITVDFSRLVNRAEIDEILQDFDTLYIDSNFYSIDVLQRIKVPNGKEKYYSELLQIEPTVKSSTLNIISKPH